jgi:predicted small lipoprotein YifL
MAPRTSFVLLALGCLAACAPKAPAEAPQTATAAPQKSHAAAGRLEPRVIQQVVRASFGRFRACYEGGLKNDPHLQGRVATRFVIDRDGSVREATIFRESDLPDQAVLLCVALEFKKLRFPKPDGGIITVVYPISFSPADEHEGSAEDNGP